MMNAYPEELTHLINQGKTNGPFKTKKCFNYFFTLTTIYSSEFASATPIELITKTRSFSGWTITDQTGGSGSWFIDTPGTTTPLNGFSTQNNPTGGSFYAVADQTGPGTHVLTQTFSVAPSSTSAFLSFDMFINNLSATQPVGSLLNYNTGSVTQFGTVGILGNGASVFSTSLADVVANLFYGGNAGGNPHPWTHSLFDITSFVTGGGSFQLRFAETDNQGNFNMGVDNVSILADSSSVPEPSTFALMSLGFAVAGFKRRKMSI